MAVSENSHLVLGASPIDRRIPHLDTRRRPENDGKMLMNIHRFVKETLCSAYYRRRPVEVLKYGYSKAVFRKNRVNTPEELLTSLGFDADECFSGFERWRPLLDMAVAKSVAQNMQGGLSANSGKFLYGLIKGLKPECVIETGVASGISTSFMYAALVQSPRSQIYSIELPYDTDQIRTEDGSVFDWPKSGVGWAIPEALKTEMKGRSKLILKDVRESLPALLERIRHVDLFVHDDLHTPDHMTWEFETVWPHLRSGGVLAADDVNYSWIRFIRAHDCDPLSLRNIDRFAVLRKP